jgi:hypothetical protein
MEEQKKEQVATRTSKPTLLTADQILGAEDLDYVDVPVPEWTPAGQETLCVRMQVMSAKEAMTFAAEQGDKKKRRDAMVKLICRCAIDDKGERLFTDDQMDALYEKNFRVFQLLQNEALKLNGFAVEDEEEDADEAAKND